MSEAAELSKLKVDSGENGADESSYVQRKSEGSSNGALKLLVEDSTLSKRAKVTLWVLLGLCLVLLVTVIALGVSWPRSPYRQVCDAPECVRVAAEDIAIASESTHTLEPGQILVQLEPEMNQQCYQFGHLQLMDSSADPCESPRQWACGGWLEDNTQQLPARSGWSMQQDIRIQELRRLRELIATMATPHATDSLEWRLKTLYESCMALDIIEEDGYRPLDRIIHELGGWHVRRDWTPHAWSWRQALETLQARYGVSPLFAASLTWRDNDTALHLQPAGLGLPDATFYTAPSDSLVIKAYKVLLKDAALSLDASTHEATRFADDIFSFEKRLADLILGDEGTTETWATMSDFNDNALQLPFQNILRSMFPKISIMDNTEVLVTAPHYINYLLSITTSTSSSILNDYFTWTLIRAYLPYMSKNFRLIWKEFQSHLTGSTEEPRRWEFCANLVQEVAPLGALALLENDTEQVYSSDDHTLPEERRNIIQNMFETIKLKAIEAVKSAVKVDGETKSLMIEEVNALTLQIGLKPHEKTASFLHTFYKRLATQKHDLFQNIGYSLEFQHELLQSAYADKELAIVREISRSLVLTEASYNQHVKTIVLPSTLASRPYFHADYPRYVQYARLGVTLGTAIAKALAIMGPEANGSFPSYAAPTVHCLIKSLDGTVHANHTQPTSVAASLYIRIIGAKLALEAARDSSTSDSVLPLLEQYYADSLFAISYAQTLCSMNSPEQVLLMELNSQIDGETMFSTTWLQLAGVQQSLRCTLKNQCPAPL